MIQPILPGAAIGVLGSGQLGRMFDVVDVAGVLHHMAEPLAGWQVLVSLLRPGGFMRVALYSRLARRHITAAQRFIAEQPMYFVATAPDGPVRDKTREGGGGSARVRRDDRGRTISVSRSAPADPAQRISSTLSCGRQRRAPLSVSTSGRSMRMGSATIAAAIGGFCWSWGDG